VNNEDILLKIQDIVRDIVDDDDVQLTMETRAEDVSDWDSVNHIKIILAIESEFGIRFDMEEINSSDNVGGLVQIVASKL
jgi:acyl carrier protein